MYPSDDIALSERVGAVGTQLEQILHSSSTPEQRASIAASKLMSSTTHLYHVALQNYRASFHFTLLLTTLFLAMAAAGSCTKCRKVAFRLLYNYYFSAIFKFNHTQLWSYSNLTLTFNVYAGGSVTSALGSDWKAERHGDTRATKMCWLACYAARPTFGNVRETIKHFETTSKQEWPCGTLESSLYLLEIASL